MPRDSTYFIPEAFTDVLDCMLELHSLLDLQEAVVSNSSAREPELQVIHDLLTVVLENGCSWASSQQINISLHKFPNNTLLRTGDN